DCNKAAHTPTKLTVCYHNGGHYDFHFLLRGFAKLKHAALTAASAAPEKDKPSSSVAGRRKLRTFGVKELSRRVQKVKLRSLVNSLPKAEIDVLRDCKVSILQRSGESILTLDIGRLRFIDTMNFCKAGLGKLIESHKRSALKAVNLRGESPASGLERAFPLTSSRHPVLKHAQGSAGGTDAVWEALLRKLPMPWSYFADCGAFNKPAVWPLECYHSELSGRCSEEVFDCYLALDITAYADLMQIFREHFYDTHHVDPFLYPSLPSATWDSVLRDITQRGARQLHLITDVNVYKAVKASMMGGLCTVFRPHSEANFEGLESFDADQPVKRCLYMDINSQYPHAMTKHLPCSGGERVSLPEDSAKRLAWLHETLDGLSLHEDALETTFLVFVSYDYPEEVHEVVDFPSPCRLSIPPSEVGPYAKDAMRRGRPVEKLIPYLGMHRCEGIHGKRLLFLRNHLGVRIWEVHEAYAFESHPVLRDFMEKSYAYRRQLKDEGRDTAQGFVKLCVNSVYGKTVQNQEKYLNTTHYFDPVSFSRAQADPAVADFNTEIFEPDAFLGTVRRVRSAKRNVNRSPVQVGWAVLELAKLHLSIQYWVGIKATLPKVVIGDVDPVPLLAEANLKLPVEFDLIGDLDVVEFERFYRGKISEPALAKLRQLRGKLGALSNECSKHAILSVVCLAVKKYSILLDSDVQIQKAKGVPEIIRKQVRHQEYLRIHEENAIRYDASTQLRSSQHQIHAVEERKKTYGVLNDKGFQLTKEYVRSLGHWRNAFLGLWRRIEGRADLFNLIMEFERGPLPPMRPEWGQPVRELMKKTRR
ncbi:unnamed protein product, partial [Symbiodinium necroappetens]